MKFHLGFIVFWLLAGISMAHSALRLDEVEAEFFKSNLVLVSEKYGVAIERALALQAGVWDNPELGIAQGAYDRNSKKYFNTGPDGQTQFTLTQLFYLAGQKGKARHAATLTAKAREEQFFDALRNLKLELRSNYFDLHYKRRILGFYLESVELIHRSLETVERNFSAGHVTAIELMRIRSLSFTIENDLRILRLEIEEHQENLRILTAGRFADFETVIPLEWEQREYESELNQSFILSTALNERPDLKAARLTQLSSEASLSLEKSLAIPNLRLGMDYDRRSNYTNNYLGVLIGFEIPIFDRNQGNIQAAAAKLRISVSAQETVKLSIERDARLAYSKALENQRLFKKYHAGFSGNFDALLKTITQNYQKRYISIVEFADSFEALRSSLTQFQLLQSQRLTDIEGINYVAGKELIRFTTQGLNQ